MKKLFTLLAFLTCFLGAKAELVKVYEIDYSTHTGFPFYVMGYVPEWFDGVMTDFGANYAYVTLDNENGETSSVTVKTEGGVEYYKVDRPEGSWHQYFIADGIPTTIDGHYVVKAMVKASDPVTININMGWGWGEGQQIGASVSIPAEWTEVEWEYSGVAGTNSNLVAQPGGATATIEWKNVTVYEDQRQQRPVVWQEWLTNDGKSIIPGEATESKWMGDAETPWGDLANVRFNDQEKNYLICAWGKEKGVNMNDDGGWDPFPATIEEVDGSHVFVVHGKPATTEGDASAWDNQFWIQSPKAWKEGSQVRVKFRYKASKTVTTNTQIHKQNPSDYLHWQAVGDVTFTEQWQDFDKTFTFDGSMANGWSIAFNLNPKDKDAIDFYFDDLSWQTMVLDEGHFVAACNTLTGLEYDFDNAIEFAPDPSDPDLLIATVGEKGKPDTYVNQVMISTIRGNDATFKSNTIKPSGTIENDPDVWLDYAASSLAKLTLPGEGVWQISLAPNIDENGEEKGGQINFIMLEGKEIKPLDIKANPTEIVIHGLERDWLVADNDGNAQEAEIGTGQPWDNQFFLVANRTLSTGEATVISFKYKSSVAATSGTQLHGDPGSYMHWAAIGSFNFNEDWQEFNGTLTVPSEANGMKSIAFNMAEIKGACDYYIKDVIWKLDDNTESLINETGTANFYVKEGAGTAPYEFGTGAGINDLKADVANNGAIYNVAGQQVDKNYKGLVIKSGKKLIQK